MGAVRQALSFGLDALTTCRKLQDRFAEAKVLCLVARARSACGEAASSAAQEALTIYEELGLATLQLEALEAMAVAGKAKQNPQEAATCAGSLAAKFQAAGMTKEQSECSYLLAKMFHDLQDSDAALAAAQAMGWMWRGQIDILPLGNPENTRTISCLFVPVGRVGSSALIQVGAAWDRAMVRVKAYELRNKTSKELLKELEDMKAELAQLRVAKVSGGAASKLAKIKPVRKAIARILTVYNMKQKAEARKQYKGKKYVPLDLRPKKTKKIRQALKPEQKYAKTTRTATKTRESNFPMRRFAVSM
eukprot:symbB.v1.2.018698.t1/scaffold1410.1/size216244/24